MPKVSFKPGTILNPVPAVMVSCMGSDKKANIITIAWAGTVNSDPPMLSVSIRKSRYSHRIIKETGEFVVNLTTEKLACATDLCGVKSGRDVDKFELAELTPEISKVVGCPGIAESPVNIECQVRQVLELGSHDMFVAEIVAVCVDEALMDENGKLQLEKAGLIAYSHGEYWSLKRVLGFFGHSVAKKSKIRKNKKR